MDKSCRSFFLWTFCSRERTLAWLLVIVIVTLSRPLKKAEGQPNCPPLHTHTHVSDSLSHYLSLRLMKCDRSDRRDPLRKLTEGQATPCIFPKKTHTHSGIQEYLQSVSLAYGISPECVYVCVFYRPGFSVDYGNVLPPTIPHLFPWYHSPPSL